MSQNPCGEVCREIKENSMNRNEEKENRIIDRETCEAEERAKWALEREAKEQFINGLKRYPEKGVQVYIDGKIAGPFDWDKLMVLREDNQFYMGDFVQDESGLREIRFDMVYHGDVPVEREPCRRRGRRKPSRKEGAKIGERLDEE